MPSKELALFPRQRIGIIGESGSGKSSLLRIAAGLQYIKEEDGEALVRPSGSELVNIQTLRGRIRAGLIQIVFQDTTGAVFGNRRLIDSFRDASRIRRTSFENVREIFGPLARKMGLISKEEKLSSILNRRLQEFSIGQRRRIGLLNAMLHLDIYCKDPSKTPKLLILDELSRGLDAETKAEVMDVIKEFCRLYNVAIIAISHDLEFLLGLCNSFRMMLDGALLPSCLDSDDIRKGMQGSSFDGVNNPYYADFLSQSEPKRRSPVGSGGELPGCILNRVMVCKYKVKHGCDFDNGLLENGEIGICA